MGGAVARVKFCRANRNADSQPTISTVATLITGGTGFVGLAVAEALAARGERAVLFDRAPLPAEAVLDGNCKSVMGDIRDIREVVRALDGIEGVVHAAALTPDAVSASRQAVDVRAVNVDGAVTVLSAALEAKVRRFVYVSSAAVYGPSEAPLHEGDARDPVGGYGVSKRAAERELLRIAEERKADVVCARLSAVFGPWERRTGVRDTMSPMWQVTRLAHRGKDAVLPREGSKDWLYSRDAAAALVALLKCERTPHRIYNVGGVEWTVAEWCRMLAGRFRQFRYRIDGTAGAANVNFHGDADRPTLATGRIAKGIGFRPRFGLEAAFADYITWLDGRAGVLS